MENNLSTQEILDLLASKLKYNLKENQKVCSVCNGVQKVFRVVSPTEAYLQSCPSCYGGVINICKHCGKENKSDWCNCEKANNERSVDYANIECAKMDKATVIKFSDYQGKLMSLYSQEIVVDVDDFKDEYWDTFTEDSVKRVWAMEEQTVLSLDVVDWIRNECENGDAHENFYDNLDMNSSLLGLAQELINQWLDKQDNLTYIESGKVVVDLTELYEEINNDVHGIGNYIRLGINAN